MNLEMLREFVSIVNAGSFTGAARDTGIPKSTLSRRLQEFETALNLQLINRSTRSLRLTSDGNLLYERARYLITEATELEHLLKDRDKTPKGVLKMAVPILFGQLYMGLIAGEYAKRHSDVALNVHFADRQVDLIEEDFDCAIRVGELKDSNMVALLFAKTRYVTVASPDYQHNSIAHPNDLQAHSTIQFSSGQGQRRWKFQADGENFEFLPEPRIQLGSIFSVKQACMHGAGIAFLPEFFVKKEIEDNQLTSILPDWAGPDIELRLIFPSRRQLSARVKAMRQLLTEIFEDKQMPTPE